MKAADIFCENVLESRTNGMRGLKKPGMNDKWYLYIARCRDGSLYVGITKNILRRIKEHNTTNKCRYTRFRKPITLIYREFCGSYTAARQRELKVKKFSHSKKLALVKGAL